MTQPNDDWLDEIFEDFEVIETSHLREHDNNKNKLMAAIQKHIEVIIKSPTRLSGHATELLSWWDITMTWWLQFGC